MIVNMLIKIAIFYFIFVLVRNILRGVGRVNEVKQHMKDQMNGQFGGHTHQKAQAQNTSSEDVVEAEFRHL